MNYQEDARDISGPLDEQIREALHFVRRNARVSSSKTTARTERAPEYKVLDDSELQLVMWGFDAHDEPE